MKKVFECKREWSFSPSAKTVRPLWESLTALRIFHFIFPQVCLKEYSETLKRNRLVCIFLFLIYPIFSPSTFTVPAEGKAARHLTLTKKQPNILTTGNITSFVFFVRLHESLSVFFAQFDNWIRNFTAYIWYTCSNWYILLYT